MYSHLPQGVTLGHVACLVSKKDLKTTCTFGLAFSCCPWELWDHPSVNRLDLAYWMMNDLLAQLAYQPAKHTPTNSQAPERGHQPRAVEDDRVSPAAILSAAQVSPAQNVNALNLDLIKWLWKYYSLRWFIIQITTEGAGDKIVIKL